MRINSRWVGLSRLDSLVNQISQYEEDSMERRSAQSDKVARLMELMGKLKQTRSIPPIDVSLFIWYIKNGNSAPSRNRLMTVWPNQPNKPSLIVTHRKTDFRNDSFIRWFRYWKEQYLTMHTWKVLQLKWENVQAGFQTIVKGQWL